MAVALPAGGWRRSRSFSWPAMPAAAQPAEAPVVCRIGVDVEDLYDLDMARDTFGAILWIWSVCPSAEVAPLPTMVFPTASTGLDLSPVETVDVPSGGQYAARRVQGTFRFNWDMRHYPFDRQEVVIPIDEAAHGAERVVFEPDARELFLTPDIRDRLSDWSVSDLTLAASISDEASTYGMPGAEGARYARIEVAFTLERQQLLAFLKLTSGVFAGVFIAFLSFFYDPNDRGGFGGKLGLLVGVLFAVLINLRTADFEHRRCRRADAGHRDPPGHAGADRRPRTRRPAGSPQGRAGDGGPPPRLADARRSRQHLRDRDRGAGPAGRVVLTRTGQPGSGRFLRPGRRAHRCRIHFADYSERRIE